MNSQTAVDLPHLLCRVLGFWTVRNRPPQGLLPGRGDPILYLEVEAHNQAAQAFYQRVGFTADAITGEGIKAIQLN